VAIRSIAAGGVTSVPYLHPDHLGSIGPAGSASGDHETRSSVARSPASCSGFL